MFINSDLLISWGCKLRKFKKNEFIFLEDEDPKWFYQIQKGKVRMFNTNPEGKEFTQGLFTDGECFGEPPLLINKPYPASAEAIDDCIVYMLPKETFLRLLKEYPEMRERLLELMANRIYDKSISTRSIINCKPETRIMSFLTTHKKTKNGCHDKVLIPFTRQEIANFTGLRVETVIRTLHKMTKSEGVEIINHKLYY